MITKDLRGHEPAAEPEGERPLPRPGEVFADRYEIEAVLGKGGFGAVFRARDVQLDRPVALKVLHRGADEPVALARFLQEARAAASLASEHVAIVHEAAVDTSPFLVMELLRGRDLQDELDERGRIPVAEAVGYVLQAMLGVAHAHARSIVHRDLKPRNLFKAERDDGTTVIKVLDFGIAKSEDSGLTITGTAVGTPRYMAPEQLRSARTVDARADLWALGVVLYELVTGSPIYDAQSGLELAAQIVADPHVPLRTRGPELPAELETILDRCLEKDPAARDPDVAALARRLVPFAPAAASIVARIETALRRPAECARARASAAPAVTTVELRPSAPAATRGSGSPAPTIDGRPRPGRALVLASLAIGLGGLVFGVIAMSRDRSEREPIAPIAAPADAAIASTADAIAVRVPPADATAAGPGSAMARAAATGSAAAGPPATGSARAPRVAVTPKPFAATARPSTAIRTAIYNRCREEVSTAPRFLVPGGPADLVCGLLSELGCANLKRRCATEAIGDDERRRCRDFLALLADAGTCK